MDQLIKPIGLVNFSGSACYYNSLLQFAFNNPTVFSCIITYEEYFKQSKVGSELVNYVKNYSRLEKIAPTNIHIPLFDAIKSEMNLKLPSLKFPNGQEDAFDMLCRIIELTNLPLINSKSVDGLIPDDEINPLNQLINLVYDNYIQCGPCDKLIKLKTRSNKLFIMFNKPVKSKYGSSISIIMSTVPDFICPECNKKSEKTIFVEKLVSHPKILIITFNLDQSSGGGRFIREIPNIIELEFKKKKYEYQLYSTITQIGSKHGGHYTASRYHDGKNTCSYNDADVRDQNGELRTSPNNYGLTYILN
jgi:hypothetical protein